MTVRQLEMVKSYAGNLSVVFLVLAFVGLVFLLIGPPKALEWFFGFWPLARAVNFLASNLHLGCTAARWLLVGLMGVSYWPLNWIDQEAIHQMNQYYDT